jgi:hypothetical protein
LFIPTPISAIPVATWGIRQGEGRLEEKGVEKEQEGMRERKDGKDEGKEGDTKKKE